MSKVTVASTTDTVDAVAKATGDYKVESHEVADTSTTASESAPAEETQLAKKANASEAVEPEENHEVETEEEIEAREAAEENGEKTGKKKGGYQRRVDKLTKQRAEAERNAEYWRTKALEKDAKPAGGDKVDAKVVAESSKDEPKSDQFENHQDYVKALAKWEVRQELAAEKALAREATVKTEQQKQLKSHIDRVIDFEKATPDFKELMQDIADVKLSVTVNNAIIDSDFGPQLMYEFAKNPAELERLNSLSPGAAERAIGRMEAKFESSVEKKTEPASEKTPEKKVTTAPKPITPVNSKVGVSKTIRDEVPYDEWVKIRRSDLRNG